MDVMISAFSFYFIFIFEEWLILSPAIPMMEIYVVSALDRISDVYMLDGISDGHCGLLMCRCLCHKSIRQQLATLYGRTYLHNLLPSAAECGQVRMFTECSLNVP
jgi:hypothetical protein